MQERDIMTGVEFRAALGEKGENVIDWFISQERKLFNDSVVTESQYLVDALLTMMGTNLEWNIHSAKFGLLDMLVEYHHNNILKCRDQIPEKYKVVIEFVETWKKNELIKKPELCSKVLPFFDILFYNLYQSGL